MARAAVPGRLNWRVSTLNATRDETATARTLILDVPGWPGHLAGQHVDIRLTAADGYSAQRSYSIASAPDGTGLELTVQRISDGEVSPYLTEVLEPGDPLELRGPIGGWFVWAPAAAAPPLLLVAGGSGIVPLMAMIRANKHDVPVRLIYSVRSPADALYGSELSGRTRVSPLEVSYLYTRAAPAGRPAGRIDARIVAETAWPPETRPAVFVCGPSGFVETAAGLLVAAGHPAESGSPARFGPPS